MIYYFIFNGPFNTGVGGHYNSLRVTASAIAKHRPVKVIVLGDRDTDLFRRAGLNSTFIRTTGLSQAATLIRLIKLIRAGGLKGTVLHAFDGHAYFFVRILATLLGLPSCYTKCGGPNFRFLAKARDLIVFSGEDADYYRERFGDDRCEVHLIPHRVAQPATNQTRLKEVSPDVSFDGLKLLRITRVGHYYRKTMVDAISLLRKFQEEGVMARLYFVGKITEPEVYEEFRNTEDVVFLTEERHYKQASELLPLFDVVIGTGRSAMEGISYGKPVLAPARNADLPRLVTVQTLESFQYYNFSERTVLGEDVARTEDDYLAIALHPARYRAQSEFFFKEHFFIEAAIKRYIDDIYARDERAYFPLNFAAHLLLTQAKFALDTVRLALGTRQHVIKRFIDSFIVARN